MPQARALLEHHRSLTDRYAPRLGRSVAEDLASEALVRSLRRPAPDGRVGPWLERIFRNLVADHWRRRARTAAQLRRTPAPPPSGNPEQALLGREAEHLLRGALSAVPAELRQAVDLRYADERGYAELAARQGVSRGAARTRVHRGLARLRRALAGLRALVPLPWLRAAQPLAMLLPATLALVTATAPAPPWSAPARVQAQAGGPRPAVQPPAPPVPAPGPAPGPAAAPRRAPARPAPAVQRYAFEADEVEGDFEWPEEIDVPGRPAGARQPSLIEIPRSFGVPMVKTIEDL